MALGEARPAGLLVTVAPDDPAVRRVFVLGDTHGNAAWFERMLTTAAYLECDAVLQLGDFGYWPHSNDGARFLASVETAAAATGLPVFWIDGNHENHERLSELVPELEGFVRISRHVLWVPRGHRWTWSGVRFGALGGAFSVDWRRRVKFVTWWPNETIEHDDVARLGSEPLDVLVTHDTPVDVPMVGIFELRADDQARADEGRRLISEAVVNTRPRLLLHGHWHQRVSTVLDGATATDPLPVRIEGFASDIEGDESSWGVLSLPELRFQNASRLREVEF